MKYSGKTVVVIPCYNEEGRLPVAEFDRYLAAAKGAALLFVDDGSRDLTPELLSQLAARHGARVAFVGFWDADLATPLDMIAVFREEFSRRDGIMMVTGCRRRSGSCWCS